MKEIFHVMAPLISDVLREESRAYTPKPGEGAKRAKKRLAAQRTVWALTPVKPVASTRAHKRRNARAVAKRMDVPLRNIWRSIMTGEAVEGV